MSEKQYIGIDPGKSGHLVIIQGREVIKYPFPKIGKEYDYRGMLDLFLKLEENNCHIVIEDVKALQGNMKAGNWSLSEGKTILIMCCVALGLRHTLVHSKTWQKEVWQGVPLQKKADGKGKDGKIKYKTDTKAMTLIAVKRLFPGVDLRVDQEAKYYADSATNRKKGIAGTEIPRKGNKPDDGVCDALAMAYYCKLKFGKS